MLRELKNIYILSWVKFTTWFVFAKKEREDFDFVLVQRNYLKNMSES